MNVLEKILEEIEERVNMVKNIPVNEDDDFLDGEECYESGRIQGRYEELVWCRNIFRSHMDEVLDNNDGWIPVGERLPEDGKEVLCTDGKYIYLVEYDADLDAAFGEADGIYPNEYLAEPRHITPKGNI